MGNIARSLLVRIRRNIYRIQDNVCGDPASLSQHSNNEGRKKETTSSSKCVNTDGILIDVARLTKAIISAGFRPPGLDVLQKIVAAVNVEMRDENEAAAFLAQCIHESMGFNATAEMRCVNSNACVGDYKTPMDVPGKYYYGRGYIQLTWAYNYKAASEDLGLGDRLLKDPDIVATDPQLSIATAVWFWNKNVRPTEFLEKMQFGMTTKAINGGIECETGSQIPAKRYRIYVSTAKIMGIKKIMSDKGC